MFCLYFCSLLVLLYAVCDVNYVIRTLFTIWTGRFRDKECTLCDVTSIYGLCTFQDCDIWLKGARLARIIRELDFARYHFYDRTGIYRRSRTLHTKSLQGSTFVVTIDQVPLFTLYKINTKLVYWDDRSLFFEHKVVTLFDDKVRLMLVSRQFAIGTQKNTTIDLLKDLPGSEKKLTCPDYLKHWLHSLRISSSNLRSLNA